MKCARQHETVGVESSRGGDMRRESGDEEERVATEEGRDELPVTLD